MKDGLLSEALYQIAALIIAIIVVHAVYVAVIRPNAELIQEQQNLSQQTDDNFVPERSGAIKRDNHIYSQESNYHE